MKWLDDVLPDNEQWHKFSKSLMSVGEAVRDSIEIDPRLKKISEEKLAEWRAWFDNRLDNAIEAAETTTNPTVEGKTAAQPVKTSISSFQE